MSSVNGSDSHWNAGRVAVLLSGSVVSVIGVCLVLGGLALGLAHGFARDSDGYYTTGTERLETRTYALTVEDVDLGNETADLIPEDALGRVRVRAERPGGQPVFVGIGRERDVDAYLRGVGHAEIDDVDPPKYVTRSGGAPRRPPTAERFWVASAAGAGRQTVDWDVEGGQWSVVTMNADGDRRVVVDADVGARVGWDLWAGIGLFVVGLVLVAGGGLMIAAAARRPGRPGA
jgi:hypothetical protein